MSRPSSSWPGRFLRGDHLNVSKSLSTQMFPTSPWTFSSFPPPKGGESTGMKNQAKAGGRHQRVTKSVALPLPSAALETQGPPRLWEGAESASLGVCPGLTRRALPKARQPRNHQPPGRTGRGACQGRERPEPHQLVGWDASGHRGQAWGTEEDAWEWLSMKKVLAQEHWP